MGVGERYGIDGYVTTNATRDHDKKYIPVSPGKGTGSGNAVWDSSVRTQKCFAEMAEEYVKLIACGGIDSADRAMYRCSIGGCNEIQLFVPLNYEGTGLLRNLRRGKL